MDTGVACLVNARTDEKPAIDTIWFDLTVRLMLFEHISGITRTIERLFHCVKPTKELDVRYCVVLPTIGFGEVDLDWLREAIYRQSKRKSHKPFEAPKVVEMSSPTTNLEQELRPVSKKRSRFRIVPYKLRHGLRTLRLNVGNWWQEPPEAIMPALPPAMPTVPPPYPYHPYPYQSIKGPVTLGPRDLFLSLGGLWIMPGSDTTLLKKKAIAGFQHVSLIYDMIPTNAPHLSPPALSESMFTNVTHRQLLSSDMILTISNYSKKEIVEYCTKSLIPAPPVEVFYLGSDLPDSAKLHAEPSNGSTGHDAFILTVGSVEARKNQAFLYYVWRKMLQNLGPAKTPKLVVAGKLGYLAEVFHSMAMRDPLTKNHILFRTDPTDHELNWLYSNCLFTVYPSMYEGWGLPVEESFVYGKLCVTTTASSLPEVGGEFADYVEPDELEPLYDAVVKALDPAYRAGREKTIREKFKAHTWEEAGSQLMDVLKKYYTFTKPTVEAE